MNTVYEIDGRVVTEEAYNLFSKACAISELEMPLVASTVVWEGDDSPEDYETLRNLVTCGLGYVARVTVNGLMNVTEKDISAGKFIFFLE